MTSECEAPTVTYRDFMSRVTSRTIAGVIDLQYITRLIKRINKHFDTDVKGVAFIHHDQKMIDYAVELMKKDEVW